MNSSRIRSVETGSVLITLHYGSSKYPAYDSTRRDFPTMGKNEEVLTGKYPAKAHAAKVVAYLRLKESNVNGLIYLEGQKTRMIEDNDEAMPFRYGASSRRAEASKSNALGNDGTSTTSPAAGFRTAI